MILVLLNGDFCLYFFGVKKLDELIKRINELYAKSKSVGLSEAEKIEQTNLRMQYIKAFRQGMLNTMENVYIVDEQGNKKKVERKK